jgi:hypothetical protein
MGVLMEKKPPPQAQSQIDDAALAAMTTFRDCYHSLVDAHLSGDHPRPIAIDILLDWAERLRPLMAHLARYAPADARLLRGPTIQDDLWQLYALSRVSDLISLPFQPPAADPRLQQPVPALSAMDYQAFWEALGLRLLTPSSYHPFFCEIAEVLQAPDDDAPIALRDVRWPGLMFGDLLIARAGVAVWGGAQHVRADIAPSSVLYFAHGRRYRFSNDLSHGWGSNSQWRTDFRRDYVDTDRYYYHVDGTFAADLPTPPELEAFPAMRSEITPAQRVELVRNRCFITTDLPSDDRWPFDDFFIEARA